MSGKRAIAIAGPTASGKSALAIEEAERIVSGGGKAVIVNTDSMQVYPVLRELTARPSDADLARAEHALYAHAAVDEPYSTALWAEDVSRFLPTWEREGVVPIFTGGTGLYFRALETGLAPVPKIDPEIRAKIRAELKQHGAAELYARLDELDHKGASNLRPSDGQRIARALEVIESTGKSLAEYQRAETTPLLDGWSLERMIVEPPRDILHARIAARCGLMIEGGAIAEVEALLALDLPPHATVLKAIGVPQLTSFIRDEQSLADAKSSMISATRQYAKRQSTWFRGQMDDRWRRVTPM